MKRRTFLKALAVSAIVPKEILPFFPSPEVETWTREELCRVFQVPPAMIGIDNTTSYANMHTQQKIARKHMAEAWNRIMVEKVKEELKK